MNDDSERIVTALFEDRESAERAFDAVLQRGYDRGAVSMRVSDDGRERHFASAPGEAGVDEPPTELGHLASEGAGMGGAIGGAVGAIAAAVAAVGTSVALPGVGLVLAGPIAAAVAGAGAGAATGGLVGALIGWSIPEERIKVYEDGLSRGGIVLAVKSRSDDDADWFRQHWAGLRGATLAN